MQETKNTNQLIEGRKNNLLIPFIVSLVGSLMVILTVFLPFASATDEYREVLEEYPETMYAEELNMTNEDVADVSLFEFGRIYSAADELGMSESAATESLVIIVIFAVLALLTALFAILKKPIPTIIFNVLSFGLFMLIKWDFEDRGVVPGRLYESGIADVLCYIGIAVVMVGAILLLIAKIKNKKQEKVSAIEE